MLVELNFMAFNFAQVYKLLNVECRTRKSGTIRTVLFWKFAMINKG